MIAKFVFRASVVCFALLIAAPAMSHDPLHRKPAQPHGTHHIRASVLAFRETGDDRYLDEAWSILKPALRHASPDVETLMGAAFVAQSRHDFDYAVTLIEQALAIKDNNDEAWLLLASIRLVLGDADSAAAACRQLRNTTPLVLLTCNARVALATGNHKVALARLRGVLKIADSRSFPPDVRAWSYSVAGDLAVAARENETAIDLYQQSLKLAERTQVRAACVDVLLNESRFEDAWQSLDAGAAALPLLVRRLIVARKLDRLNELESTLVKVQSEFETWTENEDWLHAREMARFYIDVVDRPVLARRLALINVALQREPEDLRLEKRTRPALKS